MNGGRQGATSHKRLRQERNILAKAADWFGRESKENPSGFTGS